MNRHAALILGIMNIDDHAERDAAVLGIEGTTPELLAGDMFVSLFDGIRFDDLDGASEQWEELVKEAPPDSNSAQIALSWDQSEPLLCIALPVVSSLTPIHYFTQSSGPSSPSSQWSASPKSPKPTSSATAPA